MDKYKNITVIGMGKSGLSAVRLLNHLNKNVYAISQGDVDKWGSHDILNKLDSSHLISQSDPKALEVVNNSDLIILSPGIPREIDLLAKTKAQIWCEIELAWQYCNAPVMGLTGTNGKTTTVSFLSECFRHEGKPYFVGGNIGTPFCDYIYEVKTNQRPEAWGVILELSSFQLESIKDFKPKVASILNITFSHGERYNLLSDYAGAKREIFKNMGEGDFSFWPVGLWDELGLPMPEVNDYEEISFENVNQIKTELLESYSLDELKIYGEHNLKNLYMAHKMWSQFGGSQQAFQNAINSFTGVEYRLEFLGEKDGLKIFNDAKSTNWEATETALKGVADLGKVNLILGGQLRGEGDDRVDVILPMKENISQIFLVGESGKFLLPLLEKEFQCSYFETLEQLKDGVDKAQLSGVLLFSPAFPSFDQFKNYIERGRKFTSLFSN
jgi:UDP-N-acetylmuramoylalanine--D-glutamate ligase